MRRRGRNVNMPMLRKLIKRATGKIEEHKVYMVGVDIGATATTGVVKTLLLGDDDPDTELVSDGTNIAECQQGSQIVKIDLGVQIFGSSARHEFVIYRDVDNAAAYTTTSGHIATQLWSATYSAARAEAQKNTLIYRAMRFGTTQDIKFAKVFIKRRALRRAGTLNDDDRLEIIFNANADDTGALADIVGRIWTVRH